MAQETIKLNVFYSLLEKSRADLLKMVDTYLVSIVLHAEREAMNHAELEAYLALSRIPLAITAGQTSEQFFAEHSELSEMEISVPQDATKWRTMLAGILYLASQKYNLPTETVTREVITGVSTDIPKIGADVSIQEFFQDGGSERWSSLVEWFETRKSSLIAVDGRVYFPRFELIALIGGDKNDNAKNAALNYYLGELPKKTVSELGTSFLGRRSDSQCFLMSDLVPALNHLRDSRIELTIQK